MPMFKRACVVLLVILASACGGSSSSTSTAPTNFTITVSSPNTNVLFGATEQMTAAASDGRALTGGTWSSDNTAVATVSSTGLVTPTGAGQATIIFAASSGQVGTKLLRGLPNLNGTFIGNYTVTSCTASGELARMNSPCFANRAGTSGSYTFTLTQSLDVVSGRVVLDSVDSFTNISGTIGLDGSLTFSVVSTHLDTFLHETSVTNATWNLTAPAPRTFGGTFATIYTDTIYSGQIGINGSISTVSQTASLPPVFVGGYSGSARRQ